MWVFCLVEDSADFYDAAAAELTGVGVGEEDEMGDEVRVNLNPEIG